VALRREEASESLSAVCGCIAWLAWGRSHALRRLAVTKVGS
jgi:hypothetical protein